MERFPTEAWAGQRDQAGKTPTSAEEASFG